MGERVTLIVPLELESTRLDRVLARLAGISRSRAQRLIDSGVVLVDGRAVGPSTSIRSGATIVFISEDPPKGLEARPIPFEVRYEDDQVLVVDKPPGVVVHPGAGHHLDTLVNGLIHRYPDLAQLGEEHRWGLVHRLDRDTSGLLIVARTSEAHRMLQRALRARQVGRTYLGLARGRLDAATGTIDAPIGRDPRRPTRMAVTVEGRPSRTHYRRLAEWDRCTLLQIDLETGRTHQIRVHLSSVAVPLVGDRVYGRPGGIEADPGRVWLHAHRLRFPHPSGGDIEVIAPLPRDLAESLERLGPPERGALPDGLR